MMLSCFDELDSWGLCKAGDGAGLELTLDDFGPASETDQCDVSFRHYPIALYHFLKGTKFGAPIPEQEFRAYEAKVIKAWPEQKKSLAKLFEAKQQEEARARKD
jgi:hypothetical protein